eukprot:1520781-Alexandrium_andersonii.AAC.1
MYFPWNDKNAAGPDAQDTKDRSRSPAHKRTAGSDAKDASTKTDLPKAGSDAPFKARYPENAYLRKARE